MWIFQHKFKPTVQWEIKLAITKTYHEKSKGHRDIIYVLMVLVHRTDGDQYSSWQAYWGRVDREKWLQANQSRRIIAMMNVIKMGTILDERLAHLNWDFPSAEYTEEENSFWRTTDLDYLEEVKDGSEESGELSGSADPKS